MRHSSILLLASAAIAVSLPYRGDEALFDLQSPQYDFQASNDWHLEDERTDNPIQRLSQQTPPPKAKDPCNKPSTCDQLLKKFIKAVAPYKSKIPRDLQPTLPDSCHGLTQDYFRILHYFSTWSVVGLLDCDHENDPTWLRIYWECQGTYKMEDICRYYSDLSNGCWWSPQQDHPPLLCAKDEFA